MSQLPSSFDLRGDELQDMNFWERVKFHCKQQPLVPIGTLLTTGAVIMAAQNIRLGNSRKAQYFFRWRVVFQGATLVALVAGSFLYGKSKLEEQSQQEQLKEKAKLREELWIRELERRDAEVKDRKKRAEAAKKKTQENEESIKNLEKEIKELESQLSQPKND